MAGRGKAKAVKRNGRVSLCILDEQWPPTYLLVYCHAHVETEEEAVVDLMMRIAGVMAGSEMPKSVRPMVEQAVRIETASSCDFARMRPSNYRLPSGERIESRPNIFGGQDFRQPEGRVVECHPNIFEGQDCR